MIALNAAILAITTVVGVQTFDLRQSIRAGAAAIRQHGSASVRTRNTGGSLALQHVLPWLRHELLEPARAAVAFDSADAGVKIIVVIRSLISVQNSNTNACEHV